MASRNLEEEKTGDGRKNSVVDIFDLPISPKGQGDYQSKLEKPKLNRIVPHKPKSIDKKTTNVGKLGEMFNQSLCSFDYDKDDPYEKTDPRQHTNEDEIMFGNGFESNEDFSEYKVKKLTGQLKIDKDEIEN